MKSVYRIIYDVRVGRVWLAGGSSSGWAKQDVLADDGDALSACEKLKRSVMQEDWEGKKPNRVKILSIEGIAHGVLA